MAAGQVPTPAWTLTDVELLLSAYSYVMFSTMVVFAVLGWALGRSFDRVRFLSLTDPMTGLFNRRHFEQRMAEEVMRARRHGHPTSVLCVDIDGLKAINDGFGHQAGDRAIVALGRTLIENVRAVDTVARVGGDEFALLLPETSARQASVLSRRIVKEVVRHSDALSGALAVSIGITELDPGREWEWGELLAVADAALYRAKAAGGGHIAVARPEASASCSQHADLMEGARLIDGERSLGGQMNWLGLGQGSAPIAGG